MRNYKMLELSKFLVSVIFSHLILQMRKQEPGGVVQLVNGRNRAWWEGSCVGLLSAAVINTMTRSS